MIVLRRINSVSSSSIILNRPLLGNFNNGNKVFKTESAFKPGQIFLSYNGQVLGHNDFYESGSDEITLKYISPKEDESLLATYEPL